MSQCSAGPHNHSIAKSSYQFQVFALDAVLHLSPTNKPWDKLLVTMADADTAVETGSDQKRPNSCTPSLMAG